MSLTGYSSSSWVAAPADTYIMHGEAAYRCPTYFRNLIARLSLCPTKRRSCNSRRRRPMSICSGKLPTCFVQALNLEIAPQDIDPEAPLVRRRVGARFHRHSGGRADRIQAIRRSTARRQPGKPADFSFIEALSRVHCGTQNQVSMRQRRCTRARCCRMHSPTAVVAYRGGQRHRCAAIPRRCRSFGRHACRAVGTCSTCASTAIGSRSDSPPASCPAE